MGIAVTCPECFTTLRVKDELEGKRIACKTCGAKLLVTADEVESAPSPPPLPTSRKSASRTRSASPSPEGSRGLRSSGSKSNSGIHKWARQLHERQSGDSTIKLLLLAVGGIAMFCYAPFMFTGVMRSDARASSSKSWPVAQATVTQSRVDWVQHGRVRMASPKVSYQFVVDGQSFTGDRVAYAAKYDSLLATDVQPVLAKYAFGTRHNVSYNPSNPNESVLEPGGQTMAWAGYVIAIILFLGPLLTIPTGLAAWYRLATLHQPWTSIFGLGWNVQVGILKPAK